MERIRTKIIATVGPGSESVEVLEQLVEAGVDVFRLNFSHGTLEQHGRALANIREAVRRRGAICAVMGDLCGPKIRVDPVEGPFAIAAGETIEIVAEHIAGTRERISTNRPELVGEVKVGQRLLIDDGQVRLRVVAARAGVLVCRCEVGGVISSRKGINAPDSDLEMAALTEKDRVDLAWALENEIDFVALSFVRSAADLLAVRALMPLRAAETPLVAKVETLHAIARIDEIIETADVVLVARGDLGVEMDLAQVPVLQKEITRKCRRAGKPVIIATQMLQSMVESPTATRAEVSDVANAILDAADAVMLSAETSTGKYPVEAVRMMGRIAAQTESFAARVPEAGGGVEATASMRRLSTAVAHGAAVLSRELEAKLVAVWTGGGDTARLLSKCRLSQPVVGLSAEARVCRRMAMYYGVVPVELARREEIPHEQGELDAALRGRGLAEAGDLIVVIAGTQLRGAGATNALLIHLVGEESG